MNVRLSQNKYSSFMTPSFQWPTVHIVILNGFPVGAIGGHRDVMAVFDPRPGKPALPHGGTFSANPVTMRAGIAAMQLLDDAAFARLDAMGQAVVKVRFEDELYTGSGLSTDVIESAIRAYVSSINKILGAK